MVESLVQPCLRQRALETLLLTDPRRKVDAVTALGAHWRSGGVVIDANRTLGEPPGVPGRPARPQRVAPERLERRSMHTEQGRAALLHALAHIEFNAINLALDAVWRFPALPEAFYRDWLTVAEEEAYHFTLLSDHLGTLGYVYGDFPAHDGLWEMAERTRADVLARIALVPRTLEARGLDASPPIRRKLEQAGDLAAARILDIILRDEIGHVRIGNHWFRWLCERAGIAPLATYARLAREYRAPRLKGPFNVDARRAAGFDDAELAALNHPDALL
ncbi:MULTISPECIES: ferritin-like domain-containing protein [Mycetohabitans]|uniref:ferritin-like domain-containing protein n=1 Tax=Mycetohabitans TaxID=2571159 RepID=UPI001F3F07B0|nr:ferritin-like domain-containing protein [Mycetohabitans sp. B3]MCF2134091.1 ferritin-like domain-containing protein [Mycetohabitans sp. B3]